MSEQRYTDEQHASLVINDEAPVDDRASRAEFRRRLYNTITAVSGVVGVLSLFVATSGAIQFSFERLGVRVGTPATITGIVFLFLSLTVGVLQYLQGGFEKRRALPLQRTMPETERRSEHAAYIPTSRQLPINSTTDSDPHFGDITRYSDEMMGRLSKAVEEQGRRNNINLAFGFFITLVGIASLVFFVGQYKDIDPLKPLTILNFLPRLSLVILIELFAYFFLNLYKNGLVDVKYLQNGFLSRICG